MTTGGNRWRRSRPDEFAEIQRVRLALERQVGQALSLLERLVASGVPSSDVVALLGFDPRLPSRMPAPKQVLHLPPRVAPGSSWQPPNPVSPPDVGDLFILKDRPTLAVIGKEIDLAIQSGQGPLPWVLVVSAAERRRNSSFEYARISDSLRGFFRVDHLPLPSLPDITDKLRELEPLIVHISGHNEYSGFRVMSDGTSLLASFKELADAFRGSSPRLIVLSLCRGARLAEEMIALGTCQSILHWNCDFTDDYAEAFSAALYRKIAVGATTDQAARHAFHNLKIGHPDPLEPVLHLRDTPAQDLGPGLSTLT